ncbi:MAG: hypothetical protein ACXVWZ_01485 [Nocardioides sp.]
MRRRLPDLATDAWPLVLAVVLTLPLLTSSGYPLARDLVFVPREPWTDAVVGLGDAAPRAVPLDAVVSLLTHVVDGGVLARVVLPLVLALAGWGVSRLVRDLGTLARLAAAGFAVWNPYTVERLALGQWALLAAYAALPWLLVAARRFREEGRVADLGASTAWLGLAALTPTGGALGAVTVLAAGARRASRTWWLVGACVLLQLPWLLPSLLGSAAATSDPAGVDAFSAGSEGPGGVLTALVGLGGIWDADSVPATRDSWWSTLTALLVVVVLAAGWRGLARILGRSDRTRLAALAGGGLLLALLSSLPGGTDLVGRLVDTLPGAGLLRDSQKFLAPFVVLVSAALAVCVERLAAVARPHGTEVLASLAMVAVPLPLVLVPDAAGLTWATVRPVHYPPGLATVARIVADGPPGAAVATLPWRSYRGFAWGNGLTSSDPATRLLDRPVVVSDDLQVGRTTIRGEDLRARLLGRTLATGSVADALRAAHVTWALVYRDDPLAADLDLSGLVRVHADDRLALYRLPGVVPEAPPSAAVRTVVGVVDALAGLAVLAGLGLALRRRSVRAVGRRRVRHEDTVSRPPG